MPKAYVLLGRIACGKSYHAEALHKTTGAVILSCDELMLSLFGHCLGKEQAATEEKAMGYILKLAQKLRAAGNDIILDCGLFTKALRQWVVNGLDGFEVERILIRCDDRKREQRLNKRNELLLQKAEPAYILSFERVRQIEDGRYEEPDTDEYDTLIEN